MESRSRTTIEERLLTPAPRGMQLFVAGVCFVIGCIFTLLTAWMGGVIMRRSGVDEVAWVILGGILVITLIFFVAAYRLARVSESTSAASLSRGLFRVAAFFFIVALSLAALSLMLGNFQKVQFGVLSSLAMAALCMGVAFANCSRSAHDAT